MISVESASPTKHVSPIKDSKNGAAFDVILNAPKALTPARLQNPVAKLTPTREDIKAKLMKAEERRQSLESSKLSQISDKMQKIEEAAKLREEQNINFQKKSEEKLTAKMESNKENRLKVLNSLVEKLKKTDEKITQIKELTLKTTQLQEEKIRIKLETAEENRQEKLNSYTERLREHEKHVEEVRRSTNPDESSKKEEMEGKILQKLENALNFRQEQLEKIKDKLKDHDKHATEVREKAKNLSPNSSLTDCDINLQKRSTLTERDQ